MLGLVEPQSSGLGGGTFLVYRDGKSGDITTLDGREIAPAAATPKLFQNTDGEPLKFFDAVIGGRSVGVPGIRQARFGFEVSPRLAGLIKSGADRLARHQPTRDYFLPNGKPLEVGHLLRNPEYAKTLQALADNGVLAFYSGEIAKDIVDTVRGFEANPSVMNPSDLISYRVIERDPVCTPIESIQSAAWDRLHPAPSRSARFSDFCKPMTLPNWGPTIPKAGG